MWFKGSVNATGEAHNCTGCHLFALVQVESGLIYAAPEHLDTETLDTRPTCLADKVIHFLVPLCGL
jgi:hypothetical protein